MLNSMPLIRGYTINSLLTKPEQALLKRHILLWDDDRAAPKGSWKEEDLATIQGLLHRIRGHGYTVGKFGNIFVWLQLVNGFGERNEMRPPTREEAKTHGELLNSRPWPVLNIDENMDAPLMDQDTLKTGGATICWYKRTPGEEG